MSVNVGQRNVPNTDVNKKFWAVLAAQRLATHTIEICSTESIFKPAYKMFTDKIIDLSIGVYLDTRQANEIVVTSEVAWEVRNKLQIEAIAECNTLIAMMDLAKSVHHLRSKKVKFWLELAVDVKTKLTNWHNADVKRYQDAS